MSYYNKSQIVRTEIIEKHCFSENYLDVRIVFSDNSILTVKRIKLNHWSEGEIGYISSTGGEKWEQALEIERKIALKLGLYEDVNLTEL